MYSISKVLIAVLLAFAIAGCARFVRQHDEASELYDVANSVPGVTLYLGSNAEAHYFYVMTRQMPSMPWHVNYRLIDVPRSELTMQDESAVAHDVEQADGALTSAQTGYHWPVIIEKDEVSGHFLGRLVKDKKIEP